MSDINTRPAAGSDGPVRLEPDPIHATVARIVIDNPPVNAASYRVRLGLIDAIRAVADSPAIETAVLIGAGRTFMAGADISEFGAPPAEPTLPSVIAAIDACPKPVVAAIGGAALGGGYELALACDARVAAADAVVGLPEVTLGLIPGAGGTVRLTRLIDAASALRLIVGGRPVRATAALAAGMIDAVAEGDLAAFAAAFALKQAKRPLSREPPLPYDEAAFAAVADAALRARRSRDAAGEAVAAVRRAVTLPFAEALRAEREAFQTLRTSEASAALRHLFFAERRAGRIEGAPAAHDVRSVAVVGAGTMGAGIAATFLAHGFPVTLIETSGEALERGLDRIAEIHRQAVKAGRIDAAESDQRRARLSASIDLGDAGPCELVIEAVFEDMALKRELFGRLDGIVSPGAILASNTSYLDLDAIALASIRPDRVVGLHFFSPAHAMRLVEVVRGARTSPETLATALKTARRLSKVPVIARVGEGFIGNRIFTAYRAQCELMLEDGALPEEIDRALTAFGFAMGPFAVWDLAGLDIAWHTRRRLAASRDPKDRTVPLLDHLCEAGRLGRKAARGWYRYPDGARAGVPDPEVHALILANSLRKGIVRRPVRDEEIVGRALAAIVNEAALVLDEGIAERAGDIDLVLVDGYGFPADRGGPLFWASRRRTEFEADLELLARSAGPGFRRGPVESILWPTT